MNIHSESLIHHPRDVVFTAYRDRLGEIAAYIPDVKEIQVRDRKEEGGRIKLHNLWVADREIPKIAKGVIRPEMLRWDDYATWDQERFMCEWKLVVGAFPDKVHCSGTNTFKEEGPDKTRVVLSGDLKIEAVALPGVPRLLARRIAPAVEEFIVKLITPNLERVNHSLATFLDDQV